MEKFLNGIRQKTNMKQTENLANTHKTSNSDLLDLFAMGGSLRKREPYAIRSLFDSAFSEDPELATKMAFYIRDIRGGLGERRTFRIILQHLAERHREVVQRNLKHVPFYGRWDDIYAVFDTPLEEFAAQVMYEQLRQDWDAEQPSLLAKWLKSENASSDETIRLAKKTRKHFGMHWKEYQETLSKLRERIRVVERLMSQNRWDEIDFEQVPSKAAMIYKDAFKRQCPIRYERYLIKLEAGEATIHADTLFPYEIVRQARSGYLSVHEVTVLDEQWKALPDYDCVEDGAIAVVDTSGSMFQGDGLAADIALSLGIYFAERNEGPFADKFITFSARPELLEVRGSTIVDKYRNMKGTHWSMNTNIEAVFNLILDTAEEYNLSQDEIPSKLLIISDMEFDHARGRNASPNKTLMQNIKERYRVRGYEMPFLVFWNAESRQDQTPMSLDESGFQLVSGASQSVFEAVVNNDAMDAYDLMVNTVTDERYDRITV